MKFSTAAIHAGYHSDPTTRSAAVPVYQTTSYTFDDSQHGADLFNLAVPGNIYTRIMNPTNAVLEARVAALEGGVGALALASGMTAITYALQALCSPGSNIVSTSQLYGGTYNLFAHSLPNQGIQCRFVDHDDLEALEAAIDDNTRALYCESIGNPAGNVVDLKRWAEVAERHGVPLIVDNTVATPYLCRPFEHGAHIVVHSLTKYIGGHGTTIGGAIVDSGRFDWEAHAEKFPGLTTPDASYHGIVYTQRFGSAAYITKAVVQLMRDLGAIPAPMNAFLLNLGLETLHLRVPRHCANALSVAEYLSQHPKVAWVHYPGLKGDKHYAAAQKYLPNGSCGVLTLGLKGGREQAIRFMDALRMVAIVTHVADARSSVLHPASHTHRQLTDEQLKAAGVAPDLIRFSVGIEDIEDILADVEQALQQV